MDVLKLMADAKDRELAGKDKELAAKDSVIAAQAREIAGKDREIALTLEARDARERALQQQVEQQGRVIEQQRRELDALRSSQGSVKSAVEEALREERVRLAGQAAAAKYSQDQRSLWLRSPDCLLQVLCLVAFTGHPAWNFASLSRAFRGDETLWGCIKDRCGRRLGNTFLMSCSRFGNLARVRWLLDMGAGVNHSLAINDWTWTSLMLACKNGHLEVARELLRRGAYVNAAQKNGTTSLIWACSEGHFEVVRELLGQGANVNAATISGMNCLMFACDGGHLDIARLLLAHHASKTAQDSMGKTAYKHTVAKHAELKKLVKP